MSRLKRGFAIIMVLSAVLVGLACSLGSLPLNLGGEKTATPAAVQPAAGAGSLPSVTPTAGLSLTPAPTRPPLQDFPIPSNATGQGALGDILTFTSPDVPTIVGDFYRTSLPGQGWTLGSDSSLDTLVMLTIQKDARKFTIMISPGANNQGSSVVITRAP